MSINLADLKKIIRMGRNTLVSTCCLLIFALAWQGSGFNEPAIAAPIQPSLKSTLLATKDLAQDVKEQVVKIADSGVSKRIEGRAQEGIGTIQRNASNIKGQVDGAAKQVEGRAKRDLGKTQDVAKDIKNEAKDSAESIGDKVKSLFGK